MTGFIRSLSLLLAMLACATAAAETEREAVERLSLKYGAVETEYRLLDGTRADLITATHAIEAERATKWKEAPAQAVHYALQINKHNLLADRRIGQCQPGILVLVEGPEDYRYLNRLLGVCHALGIRVWIEEIRP